MSDCQSSVLENIDSNDIVSSVQLELNHHKNSGKVIIVVEGRAFTGKGWGPDHRFYSKYFDEKVVTFYETGGCGIGMPAVEHFSTTEYKDRVIGIMDADFRHITGDDKVSNIFFTDTHDWETMTMKSGNVEREMCAQLSMSNLPTLFTDVMKDLVHLSYLRLYNEKNSASINFDVFSISNHYDGKNQLLFSILKQEIGDNGANKNTSQFPDEQQFGQFERSYSGCDLFQLSQGHDIVYGIKQKFCAQQECKNAPQKEETIQAILASFTTQDFQQTDLYKDINTWATSLGLNLWVNP